MVNAVNEKFPLPPNGHTGWPWTEDCPEFPVRMPDGHPWPMISIVTPSLNMSETLEETIRSVLLQGYPNLEYIIKDGGSTDGSVEIIKKYEPWLFYWESEEDTGPSQAVNKGFSRCSGMIGGWINADDLYLPGAFKHVAIEFTNSQPQPDIASGQTRITDKDLNLKKIYEAKDYSIEKLIDHCIIPQASTFFLIDLYRKLGGLDESYKNAFDYEFWLRASKIGVFKFVPEEWAVWRIYEGIKSVKFKKKSLRESIRAVFKHYHKVPVIMLRRYISYIPPEMQENDKKLKKYLVYRIKGIMLKISVSYLRLRGWYQE
jgi:glycosyltransferase involved in cell wall biosynthesis